MLKGVTSMARALRTRPSISQTVQALANQETERWACARYDLAVQPELKQYWALLHAANFSAAKKGKKQSVAVVSGPEAVDLQDTKRGMEASVERLQGILGSLRAGRASPGMLDNLKVDVYGDRMSLKSIGSVSVRDSQMLVVSPFDPQTVQNIEKAIREAPLQLYPKIEGQEVLVPVPRPTAERIKAMGKMVKQEGESTRVAVRNTRKSVMEQVKKLTSEDSRRTEEKKVQKLTDDFIEEINAMCENKEKELAAVT